MAIDASTIEELATAPKRTSGDEGSVQERSAEDVMKLDSYAAGKSAGGPPYGMRMAKLVKPGTP